MWHLINTSDGTQHHHKVTELRFDPESTIVCAGNTLPTAQQRLNYNTTTASSVLAQREWRRCSDKGFNTESRGDKEASGEWGWRVHVFFHSPEQHPENSLGRDPWREYCSHITFPLFSRSLCAQPTLPSRTCRVHFRL